MFRLPECHCSGQTNEISDDNQNVFISPYEALEPVKQVKRAPMRFGKRTPMRFGKREYGDNDEFKILR